MFDFSPLLTTMLWTTIAFLSGSLPFSVLIGKIVLAKDIRNYGDGNPGGTNVARAGGKFWGGVTILLDGLKAAVPVWLAFWWIGIAGYWLAPVALAPVFGHAYSPFLGFRGGKAIASTAGVWLGLISWEAPLVMAILILMGYALIDVDGWVAMFMMIGLGLYLLVRNAIFSTPYLLFVPTNTVFLLIWFFQSLLLAWKHRHQLHQRPGLRFRRT
jgi:glycerol-3-phosphate acyltransferase PlsY